MDHIQRRVQTRSDAWQPARSLGNGSSELRDAHRRWLQLVPQFETEVPDPLAHQLPALLSPSRVAAPTIGIDLLILV